MPPINAVLINKKDGGNKLAFIESVNQDGTITVIEGNDENGDKRTPFEQYEAGEEWIYVDLRDFFPNEKPYWMSRYGYFDKFLHIRHRENFRPARNIKITFPDKQF